MTCFLIILKMERIEIEESSWPCMYWKFEVGGSLARGQPRNIWNEVVRQYLEKQKVNLNHVLLHFASLLWWDFLNFFISVFEGVGCLRWFLKFILKSLNTCTYLLQSKGYEMNRTIFKDSVAYRPNCLLMKN